MSRILNCKDLFNLPLTKFKICDRRVYICGQCLQKHVLYGFNGRDSSTYVAALKLMFRRKILKERPAILTSKKCELNKNKYVKRFTELVKVTNNQSKETKMTLQKITAKDLTAFAEEPGLTFQNKRTYINYSTKSSNPDLLNFSSSIDFKTSTNSFQKNKKNKLFKPQIHNENKLNNSHLGENTQIQIPKLGFVETSKVSTKPNFHVRNKQLINFQNLKVKKASKNKKELENSVIYKDSVNVLHLNSSEIFPKSKNIKKTKFKESEKAVKKLNLSKTQVYEPMFKKNSSLLEPNVEENFKFDEDKNIVETSNPSFDLLVSYVDVAVHIKMPHNAFFLLNSIPKKYSGGDEEKDNWVHVFNILLHSYSINGDWPLVSKILDLMKIKNIKFNSQTYAAIFECLARFGKNNFQSEELWRKEVTNHIQNMCADKFSLNDLFTKTSLSKDKIEKVLETIREILPFFEINPTKMNLNSQCVLLKDLYSGFNKLQSQAGDQLSIEIMEDLIKEQLLIEQNFKITVKSVFKHKISPSIKEKKIFDDLNKEWRKNITARFLKELKKAESIQKNFPKNIGLYMFLKCLPPNAYVDEMIDCVKYLVDFCGNYNPKTYVLYFNLGHKIWRRYQIKRKEHLKVLDTTEKLFLKYCSWYLNPTGPARNSRQQWQMLIQEFQDGCQLKTLDLEWPYNLKYSLGKFLYEIIVKEVKIKLGNEKNEKVYPAFYSILKFTDDKLTETIKGHPALSKIFEKFTFDFLDFDADQIPMLCPPKPWQTAFDGGYLSLSTEFIRKCKEPHSKKMDLKKISNQKLYTTFDSLNALQAVPWIINKDVLDVAIEVFQSGGDDQLDVPKYPDTDPISAQISPTMTPAEKREEYIRTEKIRMKRQNQYGLWCEALYKLSLANHFRNRVFWLPQNFDFRGRVYPVPPHLNHLGSDLFRSFLSFAKGKPLGDKGLDWLKIHIINLTGTHKKKAVSERLKYANEILPEILDSAEQPLTGRKWWMSSEEPWQTLAACIEIKKAVSSSEPSSYISNLPIHQDGSCNGLQHYAALGKDLKGAISVNLYPSELPQDVYSDVVELIENIRKKDAESGVQIAQILEGFVTRKVVKQTVMTTVYGVTFFGAKKQIAKQLEDIEDFPKEHVNPAAKYLVEKTFGSLKQMFTSAKETQDWFIKCAGVITEAGDYVHWESPLGLPILQPYSKLLKKHKRKKLNCNVKPSSKKQKNAFPPNFIHSLDSSHMMLTAQFCEQQGLTFASIHDCFWTHAGTVDIMNRICREQFISLHTLPILQNLSENFVKNYVNGDKSSEALKIFRSVPKTGEFDLQTVLNSVYFFS